MFASAKGKSHPAGCQMSSCREKTEENVEVDSQIDRALGLVNKSLAALNAYIWAVQECRKDVPHFIRPQTLAAIGDTLADALTENVASRFTRMRFTVA